MSQREWTDRVIQICAALYGQRLDHIARVVGQRWIAAGFAFDDGMSAQRFAELVAADQGWR